MLNVGQSVGDWILEEVLASGGMGQVFRARNRVSERITAAVKLAHAPSSDSDRDRFIREAELLYAIRHPAVVRVVGFGQDDTHGVLWLAMEYVEGQTLARRVARSTFSVDEAVGLFRLIAEGLAHVHAAGVSHRDIKPSNIMIRDDGSPCLIDFGIAHDSYGPTLTAADAVPGTPAYMPPELFQDGPVDHSLADVYALAIVLAESLTGRPAFELEPGLSSGQAMVRMISMKARSVPVELPSEFPTMLRDLVRIASRPDPKRRSLSMTGFATMLARTPLAPEGEASWDDGYTNPEVTAPGVAGSTPPWRSLDERLRNDPKTERRIHLLMIAIAVACVFVMLEIAVAAWLGSLSAPGAATEAVSWSDYRTESRERVVLPVAVFDPQTPTPLAHLYVTRGVIELDVIDSPEIPSLSKVMTLMDGQPARGQIEGGQLVTLGKRLTASSESWSRQGANVGPMSIWFASDTRVDLAWYVGRTVQASGWSPFVAYTRNEGEVHYPLLLGVPSVDHVVLHMAPNGFAIDYHGEIRHITCPGSCGPDWPFDELVTFLDKARDEYPDALAIFASDRSLWWQIARTRDFVTRRPRHPETPLFRTVSFAGVGQSILPPATTAKAVANKPATGGMTIRGVDLSELTWSGPSPEAKLSKQAEGLKLCFRRAQRNTPELAGDVSLLLSVVGGRVNSTSAVRNTTGDRDLAACLEKRARRWRVDGSSGTAKLTVGFDWE